MSKRRYTNMQVLLPTIEKMLESGKKPQGNQSGAWLGGRPSGSQSAEAAAQTAFWRSAGVRREARCSRVPAGRIHSARGCSIKRGPHGIERFHGQGAAGRSRQAAQTAFWRSAGVRREARCSRVPAGRIHSARGCSIKKGTPWNRKIPWARRCWSKPTGSANRLLAVGGSPP